jgi:diketogulonate reductase-like aldo/keto reductase
LHPYLPQHELLAFCKENDIHVTAYSPLGSDPKNGVLADPLVQDIAKKHGKTPAQVLLAWGIQRGTSVIPKTSNPERVKENFDCLKLELPKEDMDALNALHKTKAKRFIDPVSFWKVDVFTEAA